MFSPIIIFIEHVILKTGSSLCISLWTGAQVKNSSCYFTYFLVYFQQRTQTELGDLNCLNKLTYLQLQPIHTWKEIKVFHVLAERPRDTFSFRIFSSCSGCKANSLRRSTKEPSSTRESMLSVTVFSSLRFSASSNQDNFSISNTSMDWFAIKYFSFFPEILIACSTVLTDPDSCLSHLSLVFF